MCVSGRGDRRVQEDGGACGGPGAVVVSSACGLERLPEAVALRHQRPPQASAEQRQQRRQQEQRAAPRQGRE